MAGRGRRANLVALVVGLSLSLLLGACGGGRSSSSAGGGNPPPATGSLTVTIANGAPSGASITVLGPNGYENSFGQTTTLSGLAAGSYTIGASTIAGSAGSNSVFVPAVSVNPVTVSSGATTTATVSYSTLGTAWQTVGPHAIKIFNGIPAAGKLDALAVDDSSPLVTVPSTVCTGASCATATQIHSTMFVAGGSYNGPGTYAGIYETTDGGQTWTQADNGLSDPAVNALWIDPTTSCASGCTLVAAAGANASVAPGTEGLYQSTDSGRTWTLTGPYGDSTALLEIGTTLYAGTGAGIYTSDDSGAAWTEIESTSVPVRSLASATTATAGTVIYAGLGDGHVLVQASPAGPWQSSLPDTKDSGVTVTSIAVNPANPQNAYAVDAAYYNIPDLFVTTDAGGTWTAVTPDNSAGKPVSVAEAAFDPQNRAIYIGNDVYFGKSTDGGKTWVQMMPPDSTSAGAWWDNRGIFTGVGGIALNNAADVMIIVDQGLYLTPDGGSTWYSLNGNLTNSIVYVAAVHGNTIITTMQDLGPLVSFDGGQTWDSHPSSNALGSEGGTPLINPGNASHAYIYTSWLGLMFSSDGGHSFGVTSLNGSAFPGCGGNTQTIAVDAQVPSIVYAAAYDCQNTQQGFAQGIYKSTDYGQSWTRQSWSITQPVMVAVDPTNDRNIFVGQTNGDLKVTHDGGQSWTTEPIGQVQGNVWWPIALTVNPASPNIVLVGLSGPPTAGGGVLRSTDGGKTFVQVNKGLDPNGPQPWPDSVFGLSYDPAHSGAVVAVRFSGVYLSTDNGSHWTGIQGNIVPGFFSSASWDSGYLYTSTFGEGVLRLPGPF